MILNYPLQRLLIILIAVLLFPLEGMSQNEKDFSIDGLPSVHITLNEDAEITKEDKLKATMRIKNAYGSSFEENDLYDGNIFISGRGNTTWGMPKKPFNINLITDDEEDNPSSLLGMPADEEWALIANYADKSLMRIPVAYYLGNAIGMSYSPRLRFVEVYLNEEYLGLYNLCEKIKKSDDRVDVKKLTESEEDQLEPRINGGYIVEVDQLDRMEPSDKWITSDRGILFAFKYPKKKKITDQQMDWFGQYINEVESTLYGPDFKDAERGYRQFIDVESFIDWYLINEFAKNTDAIFFSSVYMHKDRNKKLKMGPLWDFDIAFGNVNYNTNHLESQFWVRQSEWISRLFEDEYFSKQVSDRYDALQHIFNDMPGKIKKVADFLESTGAIERNFNKWPILGKYVWPNQAPFPSTYAGEIDKLNFWIKERQHWLNIYLSPSAKDQCARLQQSKPSISIVDSEEFKQGIQSNIKTTEGYKKYIWNGQEKEDNYLLIQNAGKYWVAVEDEHGCTSLNSDTLYFIKQGTVNFQNLTMVYDGKNKYPSVTTVPEGMDIVFTFNGKSEAPIVPGSYTVKASIKNDFYKGSSDSTMEILRAPQTINFPLLPPVAYINKHIKLSASLNSGLPVEYQIFGNGEIKDDHLFGLSLGEIQVQATHSGNELYLPSDTIIQRVLMEFENDFLKNVQVYPSPFTHSISVSYPLAEKTNVTLFTIRGKQIREYTVNGNKATLDLSFLPWGIYMLQISNSNGNGSVRIIKH